MLSLLSFAIPLLARANPFLLETTLIALDNSQYTLARADSSIPLDFSYFGNKLGGYGQYYQGVIAKLGLTIIHENSIFEQPTDIGLEVVKAFDEVAKNIGFTDLVGKANASKEVLRELGN